MIFTFKEFLNEDVIADERQGKGENHLLVKNYNIIIKPLPIELINTHDTVINYLEETEEYISLDDKIIIPKDKILYSSQEFVSGTFINNITEEEYNSGYIFIAEDEKGDWWVLNGHHRLIYDRIHNRNSKAIFIPMETTKEIDYIFYGVGDE